MKTSTFFFSLVIFISANSFCCKSQPAGNYKISNRFYLEGEGGWDYLIVDTANEHLFVSHSTVTQVVDLKTGNPIHLLLPNKI